MTTQRRRILGAGLVLAFAALVLIDRIGAAGQTPDDAAPSQADLLAQEAALTSRMRAEADLLERRRAALEEVEAAWSDFRARMIVAGSADIAFARLREIVEAEMTDRGLRMASASALPVESPLEDEPLRVVGMRVEFDTIDAQRVYALVDHLENMREVAAGVRSVRIVGPGRLGRARAGVVVELRALAWIGQGV